MTNFWDFPIYYVVAGAIILLSNAVVYKFKIRAVLVTALQGIIILTIAFITALPFHLRFEQISNEIWLATSHTPLYQLIVLWGLPVVLIIGLLIETISLYKKNNAEIMLNDNQSSMIMDSNLTHNNEKIIEKSFLKNVQKYLTQINISDLFIIILGLCAIGLVFMPEVVYVKDIYSGDYKRANTMFKLTYQAFIMFGISSGYIFVKFFKTHQFIWQKKFLMVTFILFISSLWYTKVSVVSWYGNIFKTANYKGLDAIAFLEKDRPDDYLAVKWFQEKVKGTPVILEADGDSYSEYGRISVATGLPTVLGWHVHEWLWRSNKDIVDERSADIESIYTSTDYEVVTSLIAKYNIEYIYVGELEQDKFYSLNHDLIKDMGDVITISEESDMKDYETYIVHINPKG
jgi:YYY domain-containing protein